MFFVFVLCAFYLCPSKRKNPMIKRFILFCLCLYVYMLLVKQTKPETSKCECLEDLKREK